MTHRIDESGFLDTTTPEREEEFQRTKRDNFDPEFDTPREAVGTVGLLALFAVVGFLGGLIYGAIK